MEYDSVILNEATALFLDESAKPFTFQATQGGVNNHVYYVNSPKLPERLVLRIYNNGNDVLKVKFEHEVLRQLNQMELSFELPRCLRLIRDPSKTHATISNGADAAMFHFISGTMPKLRLAKQIGLASGELSTAFSRVTISELKPVIPPYYDLYHVHHAINKELFLEGINSTVYDEYRSYADILLKNILELENKFHSLGLPMQLIHGDLHYDNVLCDEDSLRAILDFEFCAMDYRAMELAICLSKYVGEADPMPYCKDFIEGFVVHGRLNAQEIEAIPQLIILRIVSNVVYFVSRALCGEDSPATLTSRMENYCKRIEWVTTNSAALSGLIMDSYVQQGIPIDSS